MDEMSIEQARLKLGDVVDLARIAGQPTLITRQGKPAAMVVSVDWYEQAEALISGKEK
jgi:prevent-host-death family protein